MVLILKALIGQALEPTAANLTALNSQKYLPLSRGSFPCLSRLSDLHHCKVLLIREMYQTCCNENVGADKKPQWIRNQLVMLALLLNSQELLGNP